MQSNYFLDLKRFKFCSVMHLHVKTKLELEDALFKSQHEGMDCVIEVESCIETNVSVHRLVVTVP